MDPAMSYAIQNYGRCPMLVPGFRIVFVPTLAIIDEEDLWIVAQFIGPSEFARPYAERIAALLNTYGAVDDAELTSITDQGEIT